MRSTGEGDEIASVTLVATRLREAWRCLATFSEPASNSRACRRRKRYASISATILEMGICPNLISKKQARDDAITSALRRKKRPTNPKTAGRLGVRHNRLSQTVAQVTRWREYERARRIALPEKVEQHPYTPHRYRGLRCFR